MENRERIENAIKFYMLANNLKYIKFDSKQSVASHIYGSMILATAVNSEYSKVENLSTSIRMMLLGLMNEYYRKELSDILEKMNKGLLYATDICKYKEKDKNCQFALECLNTEYNMEYFFETFLRQRNISSKSIEELYEIAKEYGLIDKIGNDDSKNFEIFRFYYLNRVLKSKARSGWDSNHWDVLCEGEKISEHVVGTIALALAFDSEFDFCINIDKIIQTLCIHEVGEISIGDITPFDGITPEQKQEIEHAAIIDVIGNLNKCNEMVSLIFEFDERKSNEAKIAYYYDKLEADIQAKVYQDIGCQKSLSEQHNNVVFKSSKVQKMVQNGATTAFDIWYEWDKNIYSNELVFSKALKYVRDNKLRN